MPIASRGSTVELLIKWRVLQYRFVHSGFFGISSGSLLLCCATNRYDATQYSELSTICQEKIKI